jgi:hypothetical protein
MLLTAAVLHAGAWAHDAGIQNGVFRSRDGGATWLQVNQESFPRGALALAVHPGDPHHLLLATDSGLLRSRNGGRDWVPEASSLIDGPAFAVAFGSDGQDAIASGAGALYRLEGQRWRETRTPSGSAPARALIDGGVAGRLYLAGWTGLHRSDNGGRSWTRVGEAIGAEPVRSLVVSVARPDEVHGVAGGRVWSSFDGARHWRVDTLAPAGVDALAFDRGVPARLWLVAGGRVHRRDGPAARWEPVGVVLPDVQARPRALHANGDVLLVATDRGVYRSPNAAVDWTLLSAELPDHSETTLVRDPHDAATVYAGFSRMGAEQLKGTPADSGVASQDVMLLVAAYAGLGSLLVGVGVAVRRFTRPVSTSGRTDGGIDMRTGSTT